MVRTDIRKEIECMLSEEGITKSEFSRRMGICRQQLNNLLNRKGFINSQLLRVSEELGYDIEIKFIKTKE